jgi:hypothetical protein
VKPMQSFSPRLQDIDLDWAIQTRADLERSQDLPEDSSQIDYWMHADRCFDLALFGYALGEPLDAVQSHLAAAARANLRLFKLRGTEHAMPLSEAGRKVRGADTIDYSLTNSRRGLLAIDQALISDQTDLARQTAMLVMDPPDADYIGEESEVCTPADQRIAYAMRDLLGGDDAGAAAELFEMPFDSPSHLHEARMINAVINRDGNAFIESLIDRLMVSRIQASLPENRHKPELFLRYAELGLCAVARSRGVVMRHDLPRGDPSFPVEMCP